MYDYHCAQMQRMLRWEKYKGGSMFRLLRDNVYLTKEYTLKNNLAMQGPRVCVYREDH